MILKHARLLSLGLLGVTLSNSLSAKSTTEWWEEHGSLTVRNLSSVIFQDYTRLPQNQNNLLNIPEFTMQNELRAELGISYERFAFSLSPRFTATYEDYDSGALRSDSQEDTDVFLNGFMAQFLPTQEISLSYSREDLQWGPSFLLSPSNPFDSRNGKQEPKTEVLAADYIKFVYTPNFDWTLSFIANIYEGEKESVILPQFSPDFTPTYAVKVDYLFDRGNASVIASLQDRLKGDDGRLGGYLSYNLSNAFIGYVEGSVSPVDAEALVGLSYTSGFGPTFAVEYFHNSSGSSEDPDNLIELVQLPSDIDFRESFTRESYLLFQVYQNDFFRSFDYIIRHTQNLDDDSFSVLGHLEWDFNDNAIGFISSTINSDGGGELDSLREYRVQFGIELIF